MKGVHPIGTEDVNSSSVNTKGKQNKGDSVDPLVAPSVESLSPSRALDLLSLWIDLDEEAREALVLQARYLLAISQQEGAV
jgi:hypothetical protein